MTWLCDYVERGDIRRIDELVTGSYPSRPTVAESSHILSGKLCKFQCLQWFHLQQFPWGLCYRRLKLLLHYCSPSKAALWMDWRRLFGQLPTPVIQIDDRKKTLSSSPFLITVWWFMRMDDRKRGWTVNTEKLKFYFRSEGPRKLSSPNEHTKVKTLPFPNIAVTSLRVVVVVWTVWRNTKCIA